jgi:tetratricopeptide (TPR) repeat protein
MPFVVPFAIVVMIAWAVPEFRGVARTLVSLVGVFLAANWGWFSVVAQNSLKLAGGNRDRQRRLLEWIVKTPGTPQTKIPARFLLGANYQAGKRYTEAEAAFRLLLNGDRGGPEAGFESLVRQRLADTIEALGRPDEAEVERERAGMLLAGATKTILTHEAQGHLLDRQHRYAEAATAYERALAADPTHNKVVKRSLMMRIVLSANNAGRADETIRWAEALLIGS